MEKNRIIKIIWIILGFVAFGIGTVGVIVPILPSFPFYMLTLFAFAKSSEKLHKWFISTNLYKNNLESFVNKKGMTVKTKIRVIACVTAVMAFGFIMMKHVPVGRIVLAVVWVFHVLYFIFGIKNLNEESQTTENLEIEGEEND
ncbi:MAG: YbaN family protein [Catonella sp.]|uniref:YbaN family protein n=1 Tax=Catonella sp. TaxID=2382125 RepID=UPI003F9F0BEF